MRAVWIGLALTFVAESLPEPYPLIEKLIGKKPEQYIVDDALVRQNTETVYGGDAGL